ncbi:MAG: hypothetical protein HFJ72_08010 [Adlercreutzia sp.]|uniref:hypothetical protein n=1 Tax=uncultured Adlercreutzia sp. TaxID=875803 RepID=UPI00216F71D0|nr:hypothetical protein [uncultured Adlercreutzia sp.]MCI8425584.1 hypothetical protein [Adlercreutzia sp.]
MAKPHGSVRIGPISLFALIIILCLAVLSVLSLSTASSELRTSERQAQTTTETYQLETVGQAFLAELDGALKSGRVPDALAAWGVADSSASASAGAADAGETIEDEGLTGAADGSPAGYECPVSDFGLEGDALVSCSGTFDGTQLTVTFSMESGRQLACELRIHDKTYTLEAWKVTTQWIDDGTGETLWLG